VAAASRGSRSSLVVYHEPGQASLALCLVGLLLLLSGGFYRARFGEPVSLAALNGLQLGMSTNQVLSVLGPPVSRSGGGPRSYWVYARPLMLNVVIVHFDEGGFVSANRGRRTSLL
jgi:outer membrane protein assembly factor BamE (lipoprotein component of BamABCDE complex)